MAKYMKKRKQPRSQKRRTSKRQLAKIRGIGLAFPTNRVVKLRYCQVLALDPAAGVVAKNLFRANSIFDPDLTGGGHQPKGHDEWAQFYHHYVVLGARCTAQFGGRSTNQQATIFGVGLLPTGGTLGATPEAIAENDTANWLVAGLSSNSGENYHTVSAYYSAKQYFNVTDVNDNTTRLGSSFSGNPGEDANFEVFIGSIDPAINAGITDVLVTIEYTVLMSEPKILPSS